MVLTTYGQKAKMAHYLLIMLKEELVDLISILSYLLRLQTVMNLWVYSLLELHPKLLKFYTLMVIINQ